MHGMNFLKHIGIAMVVSTTQKMKLSIKDLVTFTEEIHNEKLHFCAVFSDNCQNDLVSASQDPNSKNKVTENTHILSLSFSQLIHFNTVHQKRNSGTSRHTSVHKTPLSIYDALYCILRLEVSCSYTSTMI